MNDRDGSESAELRNAFLRQLTERTEVIGRRVDRFLQSGWDINGICLLYADARRLGDGSARFGLDELAEPLQNLAALLQKSLEQEQLPDIELGGRLCELVQTLSDLAPSPPEAPPEPPPTTLAAFG